MKVLDSPNLIPFTWGNKNLEPLGNTNDLWTIETGGKVFNQIGQLVLKSNAGLMNNNTLDLSTLNPGMYMLKIKADNKSKTVTSCCFKNLYG